MIAPGGLDTLPTQSAATLAEWFACLAEPTRVRLLHAVSKSAGGVAVGTLARALGISQSTCSHHVRRLAEAGFLRVRKEGKSTVVSVDETCCTGFPQAVDVLTGTIATRPCCSPEPPADVVVRPLNTRDWPAVRRILAEGIATGEATFETTVPNRAALAKKWLSGHRWVAEVDGDVVGWTAVGPASTRDCYAGVGESSVYVAAGHRGRGVGKALLHRQVTAADADGLWTLQTAVFPENRASLALHHWAGYRTLGVRERIARHQGHWRDTVMLERRSPAV